jgi:hypothetical protein
MTQTDRHIARPVAAAAPVPFGMRCGSHRGQRQSKGNGCAVRQCADAAIGNLDFRLPSTGDGDRLAERRSRSASAIKRPTATAMWCRACI